jgi:hypothetical protein
MFPFLYYIDNKDNPKWVVSIASPFSYSPSNESWQADLVIGDNPLVPSMDMVGEQQEFLSEQEAMEFIQAWWAKQNISAWYG